MRIEVDPIFVNACHCRDCQKLGGSAFALNGLVEADRVTVTTGEARCGACQTLLWAEHPLFGKAIGFVRLGTLDEGERFPPDAHFFVRSRHSWVMIP